MKSITQKKLIEIGKAKKNAKLVREQARRINTLKNRCQNFAMLVGELQDEIDKEHKSAREENKKRAEGLKKIEAQKKELARINKQNKKLREESKEIKTDTEKIMDIANSRVEDNRRIVEEWKTLYYKREKQFQKANDRADNFVLQSQRLKREIKRLKNRNLISRILNK